MGYTLFHGLNLCPFGTSKAGGNRYNEILQTTVKLHSCRGEVNSAMGTHKGRFALLKKSRKASLRMRQKLRGDG